MPLGPQTYIDAPAPSPPPNGLLRSAAVIEHGSDEGWGNGMAWSPENGNDAVAWDPCLPGPIGMFFDGATTNASATFTSATGAFTGADIGRTLVSANVPAGTTIVAVTNATTVTLSANATATSTGQQFTVMGRTPTGNRTAGLTYTPFGVAARDTCSAFGFSAADYEGRARRALAARESKAVEREWWAGAIFPDNPHLASNGNAVAFTKPTTVAGGVAQGLRTGLAILVQEMGDRNAGVGMIHARPKLVTLWMASNLIRVGTDGKLYTESGVMIVPGRGYPGTGPTGQAVSAASEWAYGTDPVEVHRGPITVLGGPDVADSVNNVITARAERLYGIAWNAVTNVAIQFDPTSTA